jgi:hypothetical protein
MPTDSVESSRPKPETARDIAESVLRWFAVIGAAINKTTKYFLRPEHPASAERRAKGAAVEAGAVVRIIENPDAKPMPTNSFTAPVIADVKVGPDAGINRVAHVVPDQQEIERRRNLVRVLFNDFWNGAYEKPVAFVDRLDQAEDYLNECLAASGEFWRLDAKTRVMLGLPPRSNSFDNGKNHAAHR